MNWDIEKLRHSLQNVDSDQRADILDSLPPEVRAEVDTAPEKVRFTYYLHDMAEGYERIERIQRSAGILIDDALAEKIGRPFNEVGLECELDTRTGGVTILSVKG